jgi:murein DD-endopeptidase MepM/ murein hydrolase activator NlpD
MKEVFIFLLALAILHHFYGAVQHQYAGRAMISTPTAIEQPKPTTDLSKFAAIVASIKPIATGQTKDRQGRVIGMKVTTDDIDRANKARLVAAQPLYAAAAAMKGLPDPALLGSTHWNEAIPKMCAGTPYENCAESSAKCKGPMQFADATWKLVATDCDGDGIADVNSLADAVCGAAEYYKRNGGDTDKAIFAYNHSGDYVRSIRADQRWIHELFAQNPSSRSVATLMGNGPVIVSNAGMAMPTLAAPVNRNGFMPMIGHPEKKLRTAVAVDGTPTAYPIAMGEGYLGSLMGSHRDDPRGGHSHEGDDIIAEEKVLIVAGADGVVQYADWHHDLDKNGKPGPGEAAGIHVLIEHNIGSKKPNQLATTSYMHCLKPLVSAGQHVQRGEPIALVGKTAVKNSGTHLHFQATKWNADGTRSIADLDKYFDSSRHDPLNTPVYAGPVNEGSKAAAQKFATLAMSH